MQPPAPSFAEERKAGLCRVLRAARAPRSQRGSGQARLPQGRMWLRWKSLFNPDTERWCFRDVPTGRGDGGDGAGVCDLACWRIEVGNFEASRARIVVRPWSMLAGLPGSEVRFHQPLRRDWQQQHRDELSAWRLQIPDLRNSSLPTRVQTCCRPAMQTCFRLFPRLQAL